MTETIRYGLIGKADLLLNPRNAAVEATLADGRVVTVQALDVAYLVADAYTEATLPISGLVVGQLARVTDKADDLRMWRGSSVGWVSVTKLTTTGDLLYMASGGPARLAIGSSGQWLQVSGGLPVWSTAPYTTTGDLAIGATGAAPTRLAAVAVGAVLRAKGTGTAPAWEQVQTADVADAAITTAKLADGNVTAPKLRRFEGSAENAGAITVLGVLTEVVELDCGTVVAGDRIQIYADALNTKGGTAGRTYCVVEQKAGTATIVAGHDTAVIDIQEDSQAASQNQRFCLAGIFKVTGSGTLTLRLRASSTGSDGTIAIGDGELYAWVIPGT